MKCHETLNLTTSEYFGPIHFKSWVKSSKLHVPTSDTWIKQAIMSLPILPSFKLSILWGNTKWWCSKWDIKWDIVLNKKRTFTTSQRIPSKPIGMGPLQTRSAIFTISLTFLRDAHGIAQDFDWLIIIINNNLKKACHRGFKLDPSRCHKRFVSLIKKSCKLKLKLSNCELKCKWTWWTSGN